MMIELHLDDFEDVLGFGQLIILTGAPGVGKSFLFEAIKDYFHISFAERFREAKSQEKWVESRVSEYFRKNAIFDRHLETSVIYSKPKSQKERYIRLFNKCFSGLEPVFVVPLVTPIKRISRLIQRHSENYNLKPGLSDELEMRQDLFNSELERHFSHHQIIGVYGSVFDE